MKERIVKNTRMRREYRILIIVVTNAEEHMEKEMFHLFIFWGTIILFFLEIKGTIY